MTRSLLAGLAGLLAAVLLPLGIASVWVHTVVSDTDQYVETVTPLADDAVVRDAAVARLERQALLLVRPRGADLPAGARELVHLSVQSVVESPAFRTAWQQANRSAHEQLVAVIEDRSSVVLDPDGRVTIELGTVLDDIVETLAAQGLVDPARVPEVRASFPVMDADQLAEARRLYTLLDRLGFWLPVAWVLLVLLTLTLSRRRLATTSRLALASLVTLGLLALALVAAREVLTSDLPDRQVAQAVWDVVLDGLWRTVEIAAGLLALLAVAAGLTAAVAGRDRSPSGLAPDGS